MISPGTEPTVRAAFAAAVWMQLQQFWAAFAPSPGHTVAYEPPGIDALVDRFMKERGLAWERVQVSDGPRLVDFGLAHEWCKFHRSHASLRIAGPGE